MLWINITCILPSRASLISSLWSEWTRCLRAHRACCITLCWGCVRASKVAPASAAVWGPVFLEGFLCIINTCTTTATWTPRRQEKLFHSVVLYLIVSAESAFSSFPLYSLFVHFFANCILCPILTIQASNI